jgi:hypothetical protein
MNGDPLDELASKTPNHTLVSGYRDALENF